jgi:agmatinase
MLTDGAHPQSFVDPATLPLADIGDFDLALGDLKASLDLIEAQAGNLTHLVALGGEHGITLPLLRALKQRRGAPALIHFDAHVDTWPENFGQVYAHGTVFHHAIKEGLVQPNRMVQIGIRSPLARTVHEWTAAQGVTMIMAGEVHELGPVAVVKRIREIVGKEEVYLSFDVDALDPAFAPGTGTPEIGGLASWQAQAILRRLDGLAFVGMDVVEVAPPYDLAEITALAAATMAWEYLCLLGRSPAA